MHIDGIFDAQGVIRTLDPSYMLIIPNSKKVNYYGLMYTNELIKSAKRGETDFELFLELHRRAAEEHLKHNTRYYWDDEVGHSYKNPVFIRDYDRKWGVFQMGNLTRMPLKSGT
jgi:hypothetical protein